MTIACVLQHISCEPLGEYEEVLESRGVKVAVTELDKGDAVPVLEDADLIVAMGGPMSVLDEGAHSWLSEEKRRIGAAVRAGVPFFGVCLGAQLLAAGLDATVCQGARPEVGVLPVELTSEAERDAVFSGCERSFDVLQWHGDTFELPADAVRLATSAAYENQAFRVGDVAYGVQFHLEVTAKMFDEWGAVPAYRDALLATLGTRGADMFRAAFARARPTMKAGARALFERFVDVALE